MSKDFVVIFVIILLYLEFFIGCDNGYSVICSWNLKSAFWSSTTNLHFSIGQSLNEESLFTFNRFESPSATASPDSPNSITGWTALAVASNSWPVLQKSEIRTSEKLKDKPENIWNIKSSFYSTTNHCSYNWDLIYGNFFRLLVWKFWIKPLPKGSSCAILEHNSSLGCTKLISLYNCFPYKVSRIAYKF